MQAAVKMVCTDCVCSGAQRAPCRLAMIAARILWRNAPKFVIARALCARGNLAEHGWITRYSRQNRNCLPEIATSATGLLAMTNPEALRR